ncbi:hypothetical protein KY290_008154 [Solanum tuberosum]|uniref:GAG-pre-integrase domain-containing protein n=1 Tax=Solanum tuberosum TaxID=4113 RepID=A0ABQ7W9G2_SOLTU|nr:hypothetical protein KY290_008154 [Solanum tuberosum]
MGETSSSSLIPGLSTVSPAPNLAHQLPVKLTSSNFLLWKTQFMPMIYACGLNHHIDGTTQTPTQFLDDTNTNPNPEYTIWLRQDQLVLSWIVASVSESILPQLVGAATARVAWDKLVASYASGSRPYIHKLAALQHLVSNDDLVEFVLAGLGPSYRPFTRSLESRQEEINFDALYGLLLNEERQLKRDEALTVIVPTTQYTQSSFSTTRGRGRGQGRGRFSNQDFQSSQNRGSHNSIHTNSAPPQASDMSRIIYHNCEGKGHIARVCPSPRINNGDKVSRQPVSNLARTPSPQNWLMDSGTTHNLTVDLGNLGIHFEYQGPQEVTIGPSEEGLYSLPVMKSSAPASYATSLGVWHARLAHTSFPTVRQALSSSVIVPSFESSDLCSTCDFVHDKVCAKTLSVRYVSTYDQVVDALTKPLSKVRFLDLRSKLSVVPLPAQLEGECKDNVT